MSDRSFLPRLLSWVLPARRLHHLGLLWLSRDTFAAARILLDAAARRCRRELDVRRLAAIRIQQLMLVVRSGADPEREAELCLEVERALCRIDRLESLEPPFETVEARLLLARWLDRPGSPDAAPEAESFAAAA
jgi:hypothetical protein